MAPARDNIGFMDHSEPALIRFHERSDGTRLAFRHCPGAGPAVVFLPGYRSDMEGSKAQALWQWAVRAGRECLLFDYSGCGASGGTFADGTLSRWRDEALHLIAAHAHAPVVLVGSSMGGWLMLLVAEALAAQGPDRLAGMVGVAAAPDFTDWGYTAEQKAQLAAGETVWEENPYGPEPTPTHPGFWRDGQGLRRLEAPLDLHCPVQLLHGQRDADVPWEVSLRLAERLCSDRVQVTLIKDGDHRLSRPADIAVLLRLVEALSSPAQEGQA